MLKLLIYYLSLSASLLILLAYPGYSSPDVRVNPRICSDPNVFLTISNVDANILYKAKINGVALAADSTISTTAGIALRLFISGNLLNQGSNVISITGTPVSGTEMLVTTLGMVYNYTVISPPSIITVTGNCNNPVTITSSLAPPGFVNYWQINGFQIKTDFPADPLAPNTIIFSDTSSNPLNRLNINTYNTSLNCFSPPVAVPLPAKPGPPILNLSDSIGCGRLVISNAANVSITELWYFQPTPTDTMTNYLSYSPITTVGTYALYLRSKNKTTSCWSGTTTRRVKVYPIPPVPELILDSVACVSAIAHIPAASVAGVPVYFQTTATGRSMVNQAMVNNVLTASGTYYIRARENNIGCWSDASKKTINLIPTPPGPSNALTFKKGMYCGITTVTSTFNPPKGFTYYWQTSDTGTALLNTSASIYSVTSSGTYFLRTRTTRAGCWSVSKTEVPLTVLPAVLPVPGVENQTYFVSDTATQLSAASYPDATIRWFEKPEDQFFSLNPPIPVTTSPGVFNFYLSQKIENCESAKIPLEVRVNMPLITVNEKQGITPNGDLFNEVWYFDKYLRVYPQNKLTIFDKWGGKIFEASPYKNDFDGKDYPDGTYYFTFDLGNGTKPTSGTLTIIR